MAKQVILGHASEVPLGEGRNFAVDGELIAVFRTRAGGLYATQAKCPHKQGPLADGLVGADTVICPLHERQFELATGKSTNSDCSIKVYPVTEDSDGLMTLELPA